VLVIATVLVVLHAFVTTRTVIGRLGGAGELGSRLGLDNKWMVQAIKGGGNYAVIFERNVG
jgi:general L-amino acid transport system substrate-binding protein